MALDNGSPSWPFSGREQPSLGAGDEEMPDCFRPRFAGGREAAVTDIGQCTCEQRFTKANSASAHHLFCLVVPSTSTVLCRSSAELTELIDTICASPSAAQPFGW